ncbi:MAG: aspartate--tRNA ligase [Clostridia bacterium]|nr:aspartate--tRNA ligase [Clostridia bacterium]
MAEFLAGMKRTDYCGTFRMDSCGKEVVVTGWTQKRRNLGSLIFVDLRDRTGIVQVVFDETCDKAVFEKAELIRSEFVLAIKGVVRERSSKTNKIPTGDVEILASELKILSEADTTPFEIVDDTNANEALRLKYRYLDLRRPSLQNKLIVRNKISKVTRDYLDEQGFLEIETPFLGKSTPEGARDYLVPSRIHEGCFYALPQSPQIYKQLLMISGMDRYYQLAKCFRDEDLRANRQPEFTQIDLEMSFVEDETDVMYPVEGLIKRVFKETLGLDLGEGHFRTMTYEEGMNRYGSDKPDTRFGMELKDITSCFKDSTFAVFANAISTGGSVRAINAKGFADKLSRKDLDALVEFVKTLGAKGLCWVTHKTGEEIKSSIMKFLTPEQITAFSEITDFAEGDVLFIAADKNTTVFNTLGGLRIHLAEKFNLIDPNRYDILWITDFPMFEYSEEEQRIVAVHHPFTAPKTEDLPLLFTEPLKMHAKAYDLVINGQEAGGGSIRIHSRDIQKQVFTALGLSDEIIRRKFGFFVDAFNYGTPPHGGLALGLDRLVMLITKCDSIKEVIAFPKVQTASCLMSEAPSTVEDKQLEELYLTINKSEK